MGRFLPILRRLLLPFSWVYGGITDVRNWLYDRGISPVATFPVSSIGIGNLTVGGTGKTPHLEYLIRLLGSDYSLATLSRGYGRQTRGFRIATDSDTAQTLGDEPLQVYQKFGESILVTVGEKRAEAIPKILTVDPTRSLILLDDAYQHRAVKPGVSLLLTDYNRPFYTDVPFPAGNLRERRKGARRADAVIVTKCPSELTSATRQTIQQSIAKYTDAPVFFSSIQYGEPVAIRSNQHPRKVVLVSGIARAEWLEAYVRKHYELVEHFNYPDHHEYTEEDWTKISEIVQQVPGSGVLTTEKDAVKLAAFGTDAFAVWKLPIEVVFLTHTEPSFDQWIRSQLERNVKNP